MTPRRGSWLWTVFLVCIVSPSFGDTGIGGGCGSDDCEPPLTIGRLPFSDSADTCDFTDSVNKYTAMCPIGGVPYFGPDVVYKIRLTRGNRVGFRLTSPDTDFVLVLQEACGPNQDCTNSSPDFIGAGEDIVEEMPLGEYPPGTYYLYVDAFKEEDDDREGPCGFYELEVFGDNPAEPDLRLDEVGPSPTAAGENLVYTLVATNGGEFEATGVTVSAILPVGIEFVELLSSDCWETTPGGVVCRFEEFGRNRQEQFQLGVHVEPLQRESFAIPVSIQGGEPDPLPGNNRIVLTAPVTIEADVSVGIMAFQSPVVAGEVLTYRLEANNAGPSPATEVEVTAEWPAGLLMTELPGFCMAAANGVVCRIGDLEPGESRVGVIRSTVDSAARGELTNVATIRAAEPDPVPSNNTAEVVTRVVAEADVQVSLAAPEAELAGEDLTYDLTVTNEGPSTATEVQLTTSLQAGAVLSDVPAGCERQGPRRFHCELEEVAPDEVVQGSFSVATDPAFRGELVAMATFTNRELVGTPPETDPDPSDNRAVVRTSVVGEATLSLTNIAIPSPVEVAEGEEGFLFYQLTVANEGPSTATGVAVSDVVHELPDELLAELPDDVTFQSTVGCKNDPGGFPECLLGEVPAEASAEYVLVFEVGDDAPSSLTNAAMARANEIVGEPRDSTSVSVDGVDAPPVLGVTVDAMSIPAPGVVSVPASGGFPPEFLRYRFMVSANPGIEQVLVDTRASGTLTLLNTNGVGFPRSQLKLMNDQFQGTLRFSIEPDPPDPIVTEFTVSALDGEGKMVAQKVFVCKGTEDDSCSEVPPEFSPFDGGPSLVLPRFRIDDMLEGETTRYTVRNGGRLPVIVRLDYYDDEGETLLRPPQVRPLLPGAVESIDILRDVPFPTFPGSEKSGSVRISLFNPSDGQQVVSPAVQGDFIHIEPGSRAASGSLLFDLQQPPVRDCHTWNVGTLGEGRLSADTDLLFLLPDNQGTEVTATIFDESGASELSATTSLDSFEVSARSNLQVAGSGTVGLSFEVSGVVFAKHRGDGLTVGAPGVCLAPSDAGQKLLVPFFDISEDKATQLILRNTSSEFMVAEVRYFDADGPQKPPTVTFLSLAPHASQVVDVGEEIDDLPEVGFVEIEATEPSDPVLAGEYILFPEEGMAHGDALVNKDLDQVPADLCRRWDQRFVQREGVSTEVLVYVEEEGRPGKAELAGNGASAPVLVGNQLDESGVLGRVLKTSTSNEDPPAIEVCEACQSNDPKSCVCRFSLEEIQGSGTIEWRFRNDVIGHIAYILKTEDMSVLIPAVCRDLGPPNPSP